MDDLDFAIGDEAMALSGSRDVTMADSDTGRWRIGNTMEKFWQASMCRVPEVRPRGALLFA